ncbi:MAG: ABC transporter substrate-binding protein [Firmicutes bacterium]|nr:ABC transporter substrate-binding protein [Bacillota bacterium]HQE01424.1 ABC transporter substrate-binding protein [Bacillota bacterium]
MKKTLVCAILVFALLLGGCTRQQEEPGTLTLVDDFGREVTLEEPAQKVVSLVPSVTEIMFALGAGELVVGVSAYCNYPEAALDVPRVGDFDGPNLEAIVALEPDLVVAASLHKETVEALEDLGIPVLALDPMTFEEIYANILLLARAIGEEQAGEELVTAMKNRLAAVAEALGELEADERPVVFYENWYPGIWTAGEDTFIDEIIAWAGGRNLAWGISRWTEIQEEEVLARNPDIIIHGYYEPWPVESFAQREGWEAVKAVQQGRIYFIDPDIISRTGPRVTDAVEELARLFHPDKFK